MHISCLGWREKPVRYQSAENSSLRSIWFPDFLSRTSSPERFFRVKCLIALLQTLKKYHISLFSFTVYYHQLVN